MSRKNLLPESALDRMGALLEAIESAEASDDAWRDEVRIHVLRNYTTEQLDPYLKFHLLRDDLALAITHGGYGTVAQELLDPESQALSANPDVIVLSLLIDFLDPEVGTSGWSSRIAIEELDTYVDLLLSKTTSLVIANCLIPPVEMLDKHPSDSLLAEIDRVNDHLLHLAHTNDSRLVICDWRSLPGVDDLGAVIDFRFWKSSQAPFRSEFLDAYARGIASYVRAIKGLSKKCLILDCDNTLWGGVIGEDGIAGIALDTDSTPGLYYRQFQEQVVALQDQGIMIALCSKNNEADVWRVLDDHKSAVLKQAHLVAWRINWEDKASNIAAIVHELNIGMDAVVFVDDSPREMALVAEKLPEVCLLQVPENLEDYGGLLTRDDFFTSVAMSREDRERTRMYQQQSARSTAQQQFSDLNDYLKSLDTVATISTTGDEAVARVAQLTRKTNQFNLTTHRYTEADIKTFIERSDAAVFHMAVRDRFGDMGITGLFIAVRIGNAAVVDTLLLSCRILGRKLEFAFVDQCMRRLEADWSMTTWRAEYIPTRKNQQTADFWDRLGMEFADDSGAGRRYEADAGQRDCSYEDIITLESE